MDQAERDAIVKEVTAQLDAKYSAKAHALRDYIAAHPLPAARIALALGLIVGTAVGYFVRGF